jgi:hypothetical protein
MIPKKIYQTYKDYNLTDNQKKLINNFININSDFDYVFMDNEECLSFIKDNFDDNFLNMYRSLPLDIMRADVWRVAVIYINGGIYCDIDVRCNKNLMSLIENENLVVFTEKGGGVSNFFFASAPKNPVLKEVLDLFVKNQNATRNTSIELLVQDFGMNLFHEVIIKTENKKQLSFEESKSWVVHLFHGTWREEERLYIQNSNNSKPITFITTFHKNGYELYGKLWIESFIKNVASKRNNVTAIIYSHNIPNLKIDHPQIKVVDFDKEIPNHEKWKTEYLNNTKHQRYIREMTVRFSHKGFVIQNALNNVKKGYLVWLDGDVVFNNENYDNFPDMFFNNEEVIACQIEDSNHIESGILLFDMENKKTNDFAKQYENNYKLEEILNNYHEPYDGHVTRRSLSKSLVKFYDLNKDYGKGGIQSDPNETFLHPEIKKRFTHNIGITGKKKYVNWEDVKHEDKIFRIISNTRHRPSR